MSLPRKLATFAAAAAIAAASALPLSAAAQAQGSKRWHAGPGSHGWSQRHVAPSHAWHHRHVTIDARKRTSIGPAVAIGLGALFLGLVIADAAHHHHHR